MATSNVKEGSKVTTKIESGVWTEDGSDLLSHPVINFLARRRIAISLIGFVGLLMVNLVFQKTVPLNPIQFNSVASLTGLCLLIFGLLIRSWSAGTLNKSREVTDIGPYAVVRNPLYIGSFSMMIAFAIWLRDMPTFLFIIGPLLLLYRIQILFEEKRLAFMFRDQWTVYARRVPRFFPSHLPCRAACSGWTMFEWFRNREYRTLLATLAGVLAVYAWHVLSPQLWSRAALP